MKGFQKKLQSCMHSAFLSESLLVARKCNLGPSGHLVWMCSSFNFPVEIIYPLKMKIAADNILILYFYLLKKIRPDFSCESSAYRGFT